MSPILRLRKRNFYFFLIGLVTGLVTVSILFHYDPSFISNRMSVKSVPKDLAEKHLVFVKTHKTAGSTIQNMFMRFGAIRNLMFVVPRMGSFFGHYERFNSKMAMRLKPGLEYNILTSHCRFSRQGIASIMPNNTRYFTIMRDPVYVFEAVYSYFLLNLYTKMTLEEYVLVNESEAIPKFRDKRFSGSQYGRNQMSFDLGLDVSSFEKPDEVAQFAKQLEKDIDLVMITERLPESLILLKHLLHWSTDDIVIFHHNTRKEKFKKTMTPELKAGILHWNKADKYIYDHFSSILDAKILSFGLERMQAELKDLHETTMRLYHFCVESKAKTKEFHSKNIRDNYLLQGLKIKHGDNRTCEYLTKGELSFTYEIQEYMWKHYDKNFYIVSTHLLYSVYNFLYTSVLHYFQSALTI